MKMRHKTTRMGYILYDLICQQIRFDRGNTITFDSFYPIQRFYQIKESLTCTLTEISDIYSGDNNFPASFACRLLCLCHNISNSTITTASTGKRNRTIGTEIIAAVLHFQEEAGTVSS